VYSSVAMRVSSLRVAYILKVLVLMFKVFIITFSTFYYVWTFVLGTIYMSPLVMSVATLELASIGIKLLIPHLSVSSTLFLKGNPILKLLTYTEVTGMVNSVSYVASKLSQSMNNVKA